MPLKDLSVRVREGAAWSVLLNTAMIPLQFLQTYVLARMGTEVFGSFQLISLCLAIVPSLLLFPGAQVLTFFLPKCRQEHHRRVVAAFVLIGIATSIAGVTVLPLMPQIRSALGETQSVGSLLVFMYVMAPICVMQAISGAVLDAYMRVSDSEKYGTGAQIVLRGAIVAVFVAVPTFAARNYFFLFIGVTATVSLLFAAISTYKVWQEWNLRGDARMLPPKIPDGMWRYAGYTHLGKLSDFVFQMGDRWIALAAFGLGGLASYSLAATLAQLVRLAPLSVVRAVFPMLCQPELCNDEERSRRTFRITVLASCLFSLPVSLAMVLFAGEVVSIMGREFPCTTVNCLIILAVSFTLSSLSAVNVAHITASGRVRFVVLVSAIGGGFQIATTFALVKIGAGETGVAVARAAAIVLMSALTSMRIRRLMPGAIPPAYWALLALAAGSAVFVTFHPWSFIARATCFTVATACATGISLWGLGPHVRALLRKRVAALTGLGGGQSRL